MRRRRRRLGAAVEGRRRRRRRRRRLFGRRRRGGGGGGVATLVVHLALVLGAHAQDLVQPGPLLQFLLLFAQTLLLGLSDQKFQIFRIFMADQSEDGFSWLLLSLLFSRFLRRKATMACSSLFIHWLDESKGSSVIPFPYHQGHKRRHL